MVLRLIELACALSITLSCCPVSYFPSETPYLSITESAYTNETEMESRSVTYHMDTGQVIERGTVPYTSQYPLTCYSTKYKNVLYTANSDRGDQVYLYNLPESTQLTTEFSSINEMFQCGDKIFIAAKFLKHYSMEPVVLDTETGECIRVFPDENDDRFLWSATCDPNVNSVYFSWYSDSESRENSEKFNELQTTNSELLQPAPSFFCKIDLNTNEISTVFDTPLYVISLAVSGDTLVFNALPSAISHIDTSCYIVNLKTKEEERLILPVEFTGQIALWNDILYGLGYDESGVRGVYSVSLVDKTKTLLYQTSEGCFINNVSINY